MYNPRYARYAEAHGRTPEEMLKADVIEWPGGSMCGFMLWMNEKWAKFCRLHNVLNTRELRLKLDEVDTKFDEWLGTQDPSPCQTCIDADDPECFDCGGSGTTVEPL